MERVLNSVRRLRGAAKLGRPERSPGLKPAATTALVPGPEPGEWLLCRPLAASGSQTPGDGEPGEADAPVLTRQVFASLEAAADQLQLEEAFVLSLPAEMGLVQRLALPAVEPGELEEMARIQLEKILPYAVEGVGLALQEISRTETDVAVAAQTVPQDRLLTFCQPLVERERWPVRVVFHALALLEGGPAEEQAALVYREHGRYVLAIGERGRLTFTQALSGQTAEALATELPAILLGAELEGVPTGFQTLRLDQAAAEWRETLALALDRTVEAFDPEAAALLAAASKRPDGDLSPAHWRAERQRGERAARRRQRLLLGVGIYLGLLVLGFLWLGVLKLQVAHLESRLEKTRPVAEEVKRADAHWRTLEPAVQPTRYLVDVVEEVYECLPPGDSVLLTSIVYTPHSLGVVGEAPSPAAAVDYTDKLKSRPALKAYHLETEPPTALPGGRTMFRIKGNLP